MSSFSRVAGPVPTIFEMTYNGSSGTFKPSPHYPAEPGNTAYTWPKKTSQPDAIFELEMHKNVFAPGDLPQTP